ncbi:DUF397 domain-containing protein [Streptomyces sp. AV19]|nr:DUF397 domain-containing protein [Streptomyces sp. AV19]MBH1934424.1 DUF397 domain-containing protein [Streptomyces sp. AV19]MDG4533213.1 DUF397 domain-containing protein [Streptomyces sp. AV19]
MTSHTLPWHTSSYSGSANACLEHAGLRNGDQAVRDTKDPARRITLHFGHAAWETFICAQKAQ